MTQPERIRASRPALSLRVLLLAALALAIGGCVSVGPTLTQRSTAELGPYPEDYQQIARRWIEDSVPGLTGVEALSVSTPRPGTANAVVRPRRYGWFVRLQFRGKDLAGLSKGKLVYALLIKNGQVIARQKRVN